MSDDPRKEIKELLRSGRLRDILIQAAGLHGHYCPGLAFGVKAGYAGLKQLGFENTGMEELMAVVECNNCFVDGVQMSTGCSMGNNALVYKDLGKTAATFYRRSGKEAVRICVKSFDIPVGTEEERQEGDKLFEKAVKCREKLTDAESARMKMLWTQRSFATVDAADDVLSLNTDIG